MSWPVFADALASSASLMAYGLDILRVMQVDEPSTLLYWTPFPSEIHTASQT
jgi:hypothetical protein